MMIYWVIFLLVILILFTKIGKVICVACSISLDSNERKLPPGPYGIPLLGFMPFLAVNPQRVLQLLGNYYGSVFTIYLGRFRSVN